MTQAKPKEKKKPSKVRGKSPTPKAPHSWKNPIYRPSMCNEIQPYYRDGMSNVQVATKLGVCKETFYEWIKRYPEFSIAVKAGVGLSEAWWESIGQSAVRGEIKTSEKIWYANMKNRFKWRDNPADPQDAGITDAIKDLAAMVAMHKSKEQPY